MKYTIYIHDWNEAIEIDSFVAYMIFFWKLENSEINVAKWDEKFKYIEMKFNKISRMKW